MKKSAGFFAVVVFILSLLALVLAYASDGFVQQILISAFGSLLGISIALYIVNIYLDFRSRKLIAGPVYFLLSTPVGRFHDDLFIEAGRTKFGKAAFNQLLDEFQQNGRAANSFSPENRAKFKEMILDQKSEILATLEELDLRLSDTTAVLGWNFDPAVTSSSVMAKIEIAKLKEAIAMNGEDDALLIESFFNVDASSNGAHDKLSKYLK